MGFQSLAGGFQVLVVDGTHTELSCHLHEKRAVIDIDASGRVDLHHVQCQLEDVFVGFAQMHEAGRDKKVHEGSQEELFDAVLVDFPGLVADDAHFQMVLGF